MISGAFLTSTKTSVPRPKIYGETSRHSLLGNVAISSSLAPTTRPQPSTHPALGKRTIRYQSESRTPRRTRVEQIRERDLMMPQEVRQMPENKMVLLIEGQRLIFGESSGSSKRSTSNQPSRIPRPTYRKCRKSIISRRRSCRRQPRNMPTGGEPSKFPRRRQRKRRSLWRPRRRQHRSRQPLQQKSVVC
ncbi:TraM recognition domain-containing protein [Sinorhizobium meliloti]|nr:TraM recognition domain-containing protein [Sinorhizobium meliloti]